MSRYVAYAAVALSCSSCANDNPTSERDGGGTTASEAATTADSDSSNTKSTADGAVLTSPPDLSLDAPTIDPGVNDAAALATTITGGPADDAGGAAQAPSPREAGVQLTSTTSLDAGSVPSTLSDAAAAGPSVDAESDADTQLDAAVPCPAPTILVLLQRSNAMFSSMLPNGSSPTPYGPLDSDDRWEAVRAAVSGLASEAPNASFGIMTYAGIASGECPIIQSPNTVAGSSVDSLMALLLPSADATLAEASHAPTTEGLDAGYAWLASIDGPKELFLITTGMGDACPLELVNKGPWCGQDPAIALVQQAYANGIRTRVFGVGGFSDASEDEASEHFLAAIAHAGAGLTVAPNPLVDGSPKDLHCIQQESTILRGREPGEDFDVNWREYAAAQYGPDGMEYEQTLEFGLFESRWEGLNALVVNRLAEEANAAGTCP